MTKPMRHIRLEGDDHSGTVRFLSGLHVNLGDGKTTSVVTVTRTGKFNDPRYGEFAITRDMLLSMVSNFDKRVYGQDIFIDVAHNSAGGAAAKILKLMLEGDRLRALVEWTLYGIQSVREKCYQYLSAEYHENWTDNETGASHGTVLLGAGLTVRPVIKRLDPIQLSEDSGGDHPTLLHPELARLLTEEIHQMKDKFLKLLLAELVAIAVLTEPMRKALSDGLALALEGVTEEPKAKLLTDSFVDAGKQLAEQIKAAAPGATINLSVGGGGVSPDDVKRLLAEAETAREASTKKLAESKAANITIFNDLLTAATGLTDAARKQLGEAADLITAEMSADQVRRLAEHQIKLGDSMAVNSQLSNLGWPGAHGSPRISVSDSNEVKALQEVVDKRLGFAGMSESRRYAATGGKLLDENKQLAEKILAIYDTAHAAQLHAEHKMLAAGDGKVSDVAVPNIFERTVIRESIYSLIGTQFVDVGTLPFAVSALIPYSFRDATAAGRSSTRVYEGGAIPRAGVKQTSDTAYPIPQKIAFEVSDELRYLTSNGQLDWDAVTENVRNAARIVGEDTEKLIFDEVLNAADQFATTTRTAEAVATADGTKTIFKTDFFPVVRPKKIYDMQGNQIGSTLHPITITTNAVARAEYDGTGTQANGLYYTMDFNLGEIHFVDEAGVPEAPTNTHAVVATYDYTTNVYAFDTDLGTDAVDAHWDLLLYRYGLRKSVIEDERYFAANFGLMSGTARTQIEQAKQFSANFARSGTDLAADGNLGRIKDIANFKSTAPGLNMADARVIIGQRGLTRFRMMKPWAMSELENQRDSNGRFTGKKEAYGDQFIVLHTPTPLKAGYTSMVLYSATARVDR